MSGLWFQQRLAALDFESSDKHPESARIVTCALILVGGGEPVVKREWLVNPGIQMEPEAIAVHGITDEYAAEHGMPAEQGVAEIVDAVAQVVQASIPLVGHNLGGYDLNLLNHEAQRHLGVTLEKVVGGPVGPVLDSMVIDRHCAPFRRRVSPTQGPYQMRTTAETYGLAWEEEKAHGAAYDCMQSARALYRMGQIAHMPHEQRPEWVRRLRTQHFDDLAGVTAAELHELQIGWHAEWAENFEAFLRKSEPAAVIPRQWPLRTPAEVSS